MRPSLVTPTLNPCLFPSSLTVSSTRLGFPPTLFTTSCSQPDDFVNTSTDLLDTPGNRFDSASPAPVSVAARRNSLRLENAYMPSLLVMPFRMLAPRNPFEFTVLRPSQSSHPRFRGVASSADPFLQIFEMFTKARILRGGAAGVNCCLLRVRPYFD